MDEIRFYLNQLNYDWFERKLKNFLDESFYSPELDKISDSIDDVYWGSNGEEDVKFTEVITIEVDIVEYCWDDYFPTSLDILKTTMKTYL